MIHQVSAKKHYFCHFFTFATAIYIITIDITLYIAAKPTVDFLEILILTVIVTQ